MLAIIVPGFVLTAAIGNLFLPDGKRLSADLIGHDFVAFYTAGTLVRQNQSRDLYDLSKFQTCQDELARRHGIPLKGSAPYFYPPFFALLFVPLAGWPMRWALAGWIGFNVICLAVALWLMWRMIREPDCKKRRFPAAHTAALLALVAFGSPAIAALTHGQNSMISLLIVAIAITLARSGRAAAAGLVAGLLFYKPQMGLIVAGALFLVGGWRTLLGLGITGAGLLAINLVALPGTLTDYRQLLPAILRVFEVDQPFIWDRHTTLKAFWRLLWQGRAAGALETLPLLAWLLSSACVAAVAARAWWTMRRALKADPTNTAPRDSFLASTLLAMPLLMPYYLDYDLLLLGVAAALIARHWETVQSRWLAPLGAALYLLLLVHSPIARLTHLNLAVIALAGLCAVAAAEVGRLRRSVPANAPSLDTSQCRQAA